MNAQTGSASSHPGAAHGDSGARVYQSGGAWKLEAAGRSVAIHGRDPQREADGLAASLVSGDVPELIVAIGLGLGFLLDALDRAVWEGRVLALEPESATVEHLMARDTTQAWLRDGRLRVLSAPAFDGASEAFPFFGDGSREPAITVHPALARIYPDAIASASALVARLRQEAASNAEARRKFSGGYLLNTLRNVRAIASEGDVADLFSAAAGLPAILIAAGPSLDRALPALRDTQQRSILICVDTTLRPLLSAGIVPHLVVSLDPSEANARHLAEAPSCPDTFLVAEGSLDPLALRPFAGRTFFLNVSDHQPWPWLTNEGHGVGRLRAWGSVLTSAFDLALKMGCDPIVFAGADLAYTDDRPYCRGVIFEEDWRRRAEWGQPLPAQWAQAIDRHSRVDGADVHGKPVRTAPHLVAFRNWLLEQIRREAERQFFNLTGGGILVGDGIRQLEFAALPTVLGDELDGADIVRRCHRPRSSRAVDAAASLAAGARQGSATADSILDTWHRFAHGTTREEIIATLEMAVVARDDRAAPATTTASGSVRPQVVMVDSWLSQLAESTTLVPMRIPPHRITEWSAVGARMFFFRTQAARIIMCSLQAPDGSLTEDGRPLTEAPSAEAVVAGTYRTCRDELHFQSSDGTDPRWNGREYALLVPPCVAALEALPLQDILDLRL